MLHGTRVLDLSSLLPGPYATMLLADLGADVIKVESRMGDLSRQAPPLLGGHGAYYLAVNRNKRSLGLDLSKQAGRDLFLRLVERCDVVVESFRPGRAERMGIGPAAAMSANPRLVYCSLSGYGATGPDARRAGHDLSYLARSGILDLNGAADGPPVPPPVQMADLAAGTTAALSVCAALVERERTGLGRVLDVGIFESVAIWMGFQLPAARGGASLSRGRMVLSGGLPCYGVYRAADGRYVALAIVEPLFWRDFCRAVDRPDLQERQFDLGERREELRRELADLFATRPAAAWSELFREHDLPAEAVAGIDDLASDPQLAARGALAPVEHPSAGELLQLRLPWASEGRPMRPPPDLGADTRAVLVELLDQSEAEFDNLAASRIVFGPEAGLRRRVAPESL